MGNPNILKGYLLAFNTYPLPKNILARLELKEISLTV